MRSQVLDKFIVIHLLAPMTTEFQGKGMKDWNQDLFVVTSSNPASIFHFTGLLFIQFSLNVAIFKCNIRYYA